MDGIKDNGFRIRSFSLESAKGKGEAKETSSKPQGAEKPKEITLDKIVVNYSPQSPSLIPPHPTTLRAKMRIGEHTITLGDKLKFSDPKVEIPLREDGKYVFDPSSPLYDTFNLLVNLNKEIKLVESKLGRKLTWGNPNMDYLEISPHEGVMENAYYAEGKGAIKIFYMSKVDSSGDVRVYRLAKDPDVVTHEMGHAILDAVRDSYNESFNPETSAFHEAFADTMALLTAASNRKVRRASIEGKELKEENPLVHIAEGFGKASSLSTLWDLFLKLSPFGNFVDFIEKYSKLKRDYLRDLNNSFKYKPFLELQFTPKEKDPVKRLEKWQSQLYGEPHNYSRVFSGAMWDLITNTYKTLRDKGEKPERALREATDQVAKVLLKGLDLAPVTNPSFKDIAIAMLASDTLYNQGKLRDELVKTFTNRKILSLEDVKKLDEKLNRIKDFNFKISEEIKKSKLSLRDQRKLRDIQDFGELLKLLFNAKPDEKGDLKKKLKEYKNLKKAALDLARDFIDEALRKGLIDKVDPIAIQNLKFYEMQRDKDGNYYLLYTFPFKTPFVFMGEGNKMVKYDVEGGLLLAFDKTGKLNYFHIDSFDLEKFRATSKLITHYLERNKIKPLEKVKSPADLLDLAGVITQDGRIISTGTLIN